MKKKTKKLHIFSISCHRYHTTVIPPVDDYIWSLLQYNIEYVNIIIIISNIDTIYCQIEWFWFISKDCLYSSRIWALWRDDHTIWYSLTHSFFLNRCKENMFLGPRKTITKPLRYHGEVADYEVQREWSIYTFFNIQATLIFSRNFT